MKNLILLALSLITVGVYGQKKQQNTKPKLVVGIIVDQMRYEYLNRFYDKFGEDGFKRMMGEGFNCRNQHYHYASTVTGPGHAHVYSGSSPAVSGIVSNEWYEKLTGEREYVVSDNKQKTVGEGSERAGQMSPENLKVTTITDQLRLATQFGSKVIGVAIKDRGSILPAGHTGMAYWYDSSTGNFITSSYYADAVPNWVNDFNAKDLPQKYVEKPWDTYYPIEQYTESEEDEQPYENSVSTVFPHEVHLSGIAGSPYGNTVTLDFALEAMKKEKMGKGKFTDFLAISFSSPDYVGHAYGPESKEVEDVYIRLDLEIARMLKELDAQVGKGNYTVFLSADHAVADVPAFLMKHNIPAGLFLSNELKKPIRDLLNTHFGEGEWILEAMNYQLYLNRELMLEKNVTVEQIKDVVKPYLMMQDGIYNVINLEDFGQDNIPVYYQKMLANLYNPKRSGEIMVLLEPGWFSGGTKGTTHGTMWAYDTHVPLLWYGWGIPAGETVRPTYISDIVATLAQLLKIQEPNGCMGEPISEIFK
ncbi:alkaline phosphatase family protein [Marinilongibacter aquaticus]|uniref:alkaline phosphatase PafA n=1 Tax=Marinilongibacter aquaticus TaxID=2975157 RepID=UPI0021BDC01C|nr:alkaline phosphatase PafA [Marinilongibacter aquaticus]UBM60269.1 alkaline phosphatase family protein [Marinilongibacter aquaticus]